MKELMIRTAQLVTVAVGFTSVACTGQSATSSSWQLTWSDEFNGTSLDTTKWTVDTGDSFGTGQEDYDTADNMTVTGGNLAITARQESVGGASYTSGRIETGAGFAQAYGRFEARMQLPTGQGAWPAFWLLGSNYAQVGWPECGELDIMESRGAVPGTVFGSMHGPGPYTETQGFALDGGESFAAAFHVFALEWDPGVVRWYVDDQLYETQSADLFPASQPWVFDHPFYVILDFALGGQFGGPVTSATPLPQSLLVDYVRVYTRAPQEDAGDATVGP
jgi:beta-glucanase (GH16 family)